MSDVLGTIDALQQYNPDFSSVTFKSSGDYSQNTIDLASYVKHHTTAEPLVHLTCGALDTTEVDRLANDADGIHIYTMNNARVAGEIYSRINNVIEKELR